MDFTIDGMLNALIGRKATEYLADCGITGTAADLALSEMVRTVIENRPIIEQWLYMQSALNHLYKIDSQLHLRHDVLSIIGEHLAAAQDDLLFALSTDVSIQRVQDQLRDIELRYIPR